MLMTDFNEQLMRRLDTIDRNISTIISTSSANGATLSILQNEMRENRTLNHQRFDKINSMFVAEEERLDDHERRLTTVETHFTTLYRIAAVIGAMFLAAMGWFSNLWQKLF